MTILLALELVGTAACTSIVQPCLNVAPYDDGEDSSDPKLDVEPEPNVRPCLSPVEPDEPPLTPCLSPVAPDEPPVTPCLEVALPDEPPLTPCLKVLPPPESKKKIEGLELGPCLRVAPQHSGLGNQALPSQPHEDDEIAARADVLDRLADSLPPDVLAKLRRREE